MGLSQSHFCWLPTGKDVWTPFTYSGVHATERVLRRKEQHRFWGVDCYSHQEDRYFRIGNRLFYEDPDKEVEPSALVVVAADAWAGELARNTLSGSTPTVCWQPANVRHSDPREITSWMDDW